VAEHTAMTTAKDKAPGTKAWGVMIRTRARTAVKVLEQSYMDLAMILSIVYRTHVEDDPSKPLVCTTWGYKSWNEWVYQDLGLNPHKANALRLIADRAESVLEGQPELRPRLEAVGWTKAREILRVAAKDTLPQWVDYAEKKSFADLEVTVKAQLTKAQSASSPTQGAGSSAPYEAASPGSPEAELPAIQVSPSDVLTRKVFMLHPGQLQVVQQALDRAQEASGSEVPSHNLSLVCTQFLASNAFTVSEHSRALLLRSLADALGLRIIALESSDNVIFDSQYTPSPSPSPNQ